MVISTLCEDGSTTLGPYSLVQPYYVAGKDFYANYTRTVGFCSLQIPCLL